MFQSWMRPTKMLAAAGVACLLLLAALGLHPGGVAARAEPVRAQAGPAALRIDANHRATTDAIFAVNEPIVFWSNLPDGSARAFAVREDGFPNARPDGTLDVTIGDDAWRAIPAEATSLVAHGLASGVNAVYVFNR